MADVAGMGHPFPTPAVIGDLWAFSLSATVTTTTFGYCDKNSTPRVASLATAKLLLLFSFQKVYTPLYQVWSQF